MLPTTERLSPDSGRLSEVSLAEPLAWYPPPSTPTSTPTTLLSFVSSRLSVHSDDSLSLPSHPVASIYPGAT